MNVLAWNCRGLGNRSTVATLSKLLQLEAPSLVFLSETKLKISEIRGLNKRWGYKYVIGVDCDGQSRQGGLALLWHDCLNVSVLFLSLHCIDVKVNEISDPFNYWRLSGVYGWPSGGEKYNTWDLLRSLHGNSQLSWVCLGDFNKIMWSLEKRGGRHKPASAMADFRRALDDCSLQDLGFKGAPFTWCNNQRGDGLIMERLDRGVATQSCLDLFPDSNLFHLPRFGSDHCPILLQLIPKKVTRRRGHLFRFEASWLRDEGCAATVDVAWKSNGTAVGNLFIGDRLRLCGDSLSRWSRLSFSFIPRKIISQRAKLAKLLLLPVSDHVQEEIRGLSRDLEELIHREEIMWQQRSQSLWLEAGDKNTSFFHGRASQRRKKNRIHGINDELGVWHEDHEAVESIFTEYFKKLFTSAGPVEMTNALQPVHPIVSNSMNSHLTAPLYE